jgi:hypothetical protein
MKFSLLGGLLFAGLISILLAGCGQTEVLDSGYDIDDYGIVNDSTAIVKINYWDHIQKGSNILTSSDDWYAGTGKGLLLVSTKEEKIYKEINIEKSASKQILDSLLLLWNYVNDEIYFSKPAYLNIQKENEKIFLDLDSIADSTDVLKLWNEKKFNDIVFSIKYSNADLGRIYFLLELAGRIIKKFVPTGESSWISECADIQLTPQKVRCIKLNSGFVEIEDEKQNVLDSIYVGDYYKIVRFLGNYLEIDEKIYEMDENGKINHTPIYTITKYYNYISFQDSIGNGTSYSGGKP